MKRQPQGPAAVGAGQAPTREPSARQRAAVHRAIERSSFCTLATVSAEQRPLVTGVLYQEVEGLLYVCALGESVKVRNVQATERVAVCIPVRRLPIGPPFSVQFQARARIRERDDPRIAALLRARRLRRITRHGELRDPTACFIEISRGPRVATYGLGVPWPELLRDSVHASRSFRLV